MATMTITGTFREFDDEPAEVQPLSIRANARVVDLAGNVIFERDTIDVAAGTFSYDCPAPGDGIEPAVFGYIVTGFVDGEWVTWQIPAAAGAVDLTDFTETTPIPVATAETIIAAAVAEHSADTTDVHGIPDTTQLATTADLAAAVADLVSSGDLTAAINALVDAAPGALDTLNELSAALGDDADFAATITTALATETAQRTAADDGLAVDLDDGLAGKVDEPNLTAWPMWVYGNSYADVVAKPYYTLGGHYLQQVQAELGAGALTSYAISGTQIIDVCGGLVNDNKITGSTGQTAGALWPSTSGRSGLVVLEAVVNDIVAFLTATGYTPVAITNANTQYVDGVRSMYRHALALMSSESRIEAGNAVLTGTWATIASTAYSGGSIRRSNAVGSKAAFTVTPPQTGPLAGKVFLIGAKVNPATATLTQMTVDVDGANAFTYTANQWEAGRPTASAYDCIAISVPVDGNAHTVNVTHTGTAGQWIYADALIVPSEDPNPIAVMGGEHPIKVGVWNAAQVAAYKANQAKLLPVIKAVVAEFPNALYVPSTITPNGLYSADGVHPNDRGQAQRAADLKASVRTIKARLDSRALAVAADASFGIV